MVEYFSSPDVHVFFIDYDESRQNLEYAQEKWGELLEAEIPDHYRDTVRDSLLSQWTLSELTDELYSDIV